MAHCDENLAKIYAALTHYQVTHEGKNPPRLHDLEGIDGLTAWNFICPAGSAGIGESPWVWRGADLDENAPAQMILAYDTKPVHKGRRNILFADGSLKRPPEHFLKKAILIDNDLRRTYGLLEIPGP